MSHLTALSTYTGAVNGVLESWADFLDERAAELEALQRQHPRARITFDDPGPNFGGMLRQYSIEVIRELDRLQRVRWVDAEDRADTIAAWRLVAQHAICDTYPQANNRVGIATEKVRSLIKNAERERRASR